MIDENSVVIVTEEKCKPYSVSTFVKNENYGIALESQTNSFGNFINRVEEEYRAAKRGVCITYGACAIKSNSPPNPPRKIGGL